MESCLLCLEINKDILDFIKSGTTQWADLDIAKIIEKHFWTMNNKQLDSWICFSCWRELENFHKFYLRIEEAHVNFGKIKEEDLTGTLECKKEIALPQSANDDSELEDEKMLFCTLESGIVDQLQQRNITEPEILLDISTSLDMHNEKEIIMSDPSDDLDDIPLMQVCKRLRVRKNLASKDPLEKSRKYKTKSNSKDKLNTDHKSTANNEAADSKVKDEPMDLNYINNEDSNSINDNDVSDTTYKREEKDISESENTNRETYNKHRTSRNENDKFITEHFKQMFCDLCQVPFKDFPAMQKHFKDNHKQRGFVVCCKRKFFNRTRLVDHLHRHLNPDHFKCNECGKALSDRRSFDSHMLRVHRANEVVKQHCCDLCGKSFTKAYVLKIHKLTHLTEDEKKFPCSDCGKKYGSPYILKLHSQAVHLKRFAKICYICGKAINSSAEFKIHMNKHEGIPQPIVNCDVCGLGLTSERGLKLHKESQHPVGGKQNHQCPICPRVSPSLTALKKHINTMHAKGFDHKCSICEKAFKRSEALREHMATHTGTALYTCPWCPKTFNSNGNMHAHRKKIHPKEWEESKLQKYSCNIVL